ncbi:MAG: hypothetical protein QOE68_4481, partial [Thermoanaerobaculia bacterium]|nr:hypothetical protein [Thermoanaerobaculia bacterium]
ATPASTATPSISAIRAATAAGLAGLQLARRPGEARRCVAPTGEREPGDLDVARRRQRADLQYQLARSGQFLIRQRQVARCERGAVGDEDAEVKRLERSGRDGDGGCDPEPAFQTLISLTSPMISFGSVIA